MSKKCSIIIIGKNSFIGLNLIKYLQEKKTKVLAISFQEFLKLKKKRISNFNFICNCAVNRKYVNNKYKFQYDFDARIANKIKNIDIKYIFLSSRKVYKPKFNINESSQTNPVDNYAANKLKTEKYLLNQKKEKIIILRISNIIGKKIKENYRQVNFTFFDNYYFSVKNNLKVKYKNFFKDFLSINQFTKIMYLILVKDLEGIFNLSLGKKIYIRDLINWLNYKNKNKKYFLGKTVKIIDQNESFTLNNTKLIKKINYRPKKVELKNFCKKLSKVIH